ncbi:MAG: signal peptidase I [bacterium]
MGSKQESKRSAYTDTNIIHSHFQKYAKIYWEYLQAILIAIVLALLVRAFIIQAFKIPSGSMLETLQIGDHILVNKFIFHFTEPKRGDIIVFKFPGDKKKDYIKRLIGVPGDRLEIKNQQIYINNVLLDEPLVEEYAEHKGIRTDIPQRDDFGPMIIPEKCYFMMGDNRDRSSDSRFWGLLKRELIEGKAFIIYWSWDKDKDFFNWSWKKGERYFGRIRLSRLFKLLH